MYGGKSSDVKVNEFPPSMGIDVHKVKLKEVKAHTTEPNSSGNTYDVLDISFVNAKKETHTIRCFNPENGDESKAAKNAEYYSKLVCYIANKLRGEEVSIPEDVNSWGAFTDAAVELLTVEGEAPKLWLKLVGNVFNGKANVQITRYFGWLKREDEDKPTYSNNELKANRDYNEFHNPTAGGSGGGNDDDDDLPF